jgi:hypothetical protein
VVGVDEELVSAEVDEELVSAEVELVVSDEVLLSDVDEETALPLVGALCTTEEEEVPEEAVARPGSVPALTRNPMRAATTANTAKLLPPMLSHDGVRRGLGVGGVLMAGDRDG